MEIGGLMVPRMGLEPTRPMATDFKSVVSTDSTTSARGWVERRLVYAVLCVSSMGEFISFRKLINEKCCNSKLQHFCDFLVRVFLVCDADIAKEAVGLDL